MAVIGGTSGSDTLVGNAKGEDDTINGGRGDDHITGLSGDDFLSGGRDNDTLIGGIGSDVMSGGSMTSAGGIDSDVFEWSAGHIGEGNIDWVTDFSIGSDVLSFRSSGGGQNLVIDSATRAYVTNTTFNGNNLDNNVDTGTDIILTVRNSVTGATQQIVLLDSWSGTLAPQWDAYFTSLGLTLGDNVGKVTLNDIM
jgi:Ca2+-binding RTX toxin-like protein